MPGNTAAKIHGPFTHGLNKGGLEDIRKNRRLKATEAAGIAGSSSAVRAHVGSFEVLQKRWCWFSPTYKDTIFIEFTSDAAPDSHPSIATWYLPEGEYLPITITGVFTGAGRKI